ncbi:hypothetical protein ACNKHM_07675 [Shigella sonnei]
MTKLTCVATSRGGQRADDAPALLDHFLDDAVEVDVDAICDGEVVLIGGIMEHIQQAACTPVTPHVRCQPTP